MARLQVMVPLPLRLAQQLAMSHRMHPESLQVIITHSQQRDPVDPILSESRAVLPKSDGF